MTIAHATDRAASASDYVALLKPRVMSLVVFTALVGYVAAPARGDWVLGFAIILAIAVGAGASGALNMWFDADIDAVMARTQNRPIPAGRVAKEEALGMGIFLSVFAVMTMQLAAGPLAAGLLAFTIFFYAVVYTMWLKRWTAQNIVIGGLAGALPPAIAWAAKTGSVATIEPWLLVAIIFMWTPPHFWSLSLLRHQEYAAANVPMLSVTKGARVTRWHIFAYALLLAPPGVTPVLTGLGGMLYACVSVSGGLAFIALALRVLRSTAGDDGGDNRPARDLFGFSILYLFALFAVLLVEHVRP